MALSRDEGESWESSKRLEDDPAGTYSYGAIEFLEDEVVLVYGASDARNPGQGGMQVCLVALSWLYE